MILNAWQVEYDHPSLAAFTKSELTDQEHFTFAQKIIDHHANTNAQAETQEEKERCWPWDSATHQF